MNESTEMYLETILLLEQELHRVRSIDIANKMGFSRPTVSIAVKKLREADLVTIDETGAVSLTEQGKEKADSVYERHEVIAQLLISFGVSPQAAYEDSCRIEHVISDESFTCLKKQHQQNKKLTP